MPELNLFTGGINLAKDRFKLDSNEMLECINADILSGSVVSISEAELAILPYAGYTGTKKNFVNYLNRWVSQNGEKVSYAHFNHNLFRADGGIPMYTVGNHSSKVFIGDEKLRWYPLGLDAPDEQLQFIRHEETNIKFTTLQKDGFMPDNELHYRILYDDGSIKTAVYTPTKDNGIVEITLLGNDHMVLFRQSEGKFYKVHDTNYGRVYHDGNLQFLNIDADFKIIKPYMGRTGQSRILPTPEFYHGSKAYSSSVGKHTCDSATGDCSNYDGRYYTTYARPITSSGRYPNSGRLVGSIIRYFPTSSGRVKVLTTYGREGLAWADGASGGTEMTSSVGSVVHSYLAKKLSFHLAEDGRTALGFDTARNRIVRLNMGTRPTTSSQRVANKNLVAHQMWDLGGTVWGLFKNDYGELGMYKLVKNTFKLQSATIEEDPYFNEASYNNVPNNYTAGMQKLGILFVMFNKKIMLYNTVNGTMAFRRFIANPTKGSSGANSIISMFDNVIRLFDGAGHTSFCRTCSPQVSGRRYSRYVELQAALDFSSVDKASPLIADTLTGTYIYALTAVDSNNHETAVGVLSNPVTLSTEQVSIVIPSPTPPVAGYKLYRKNDGAYSGSTELLFVAEFQNGTNYLDKKSIDDLGGIAPEPTTSPAPRDLLYITEYKGRLFGATKAYTFIDKFRPATSAEYPAVKSKGRGDYWIIKSPWTWTHGSLQGYSAEKEDILMWEGDDWVIFNPRTLQDYREYFTLVWSELGNATNWKGLNFLNVSHHVTGLGKTANGLVIFHKGSCDVLLGTETDSFTKRIISGSQGCVSHKSIQSWKGNCIFVSEDSINLTDGGSITNISRNKIGYINFHEFVASALVDDVYCFIADNRLYLMDLVDGIVRTMDVQDYTGLYSHEGNLYASNGFDLFIVPIRSEQRDGLNYTIRTGNITDSAINNLKEYDKVRIQYEGSCQVKVLIDDYVVVTSNEPDMVGIPNEFNKGYSIQFEVTGTGKLHAIEYSLKGRENN